MKMLYKSYYAVRGLIPRGAQIRMRQGLTHWQEAGCHAVWPIDPRAAVQRPPWDSWPEKKSFALILTHDVDTAAGLINCESLMKLEQEFGFRSSFNFVPLRYATPPRLQQMLRDQGFEVGVHGLYHDGKLYQSKTIFMERVAKINGYLKSWNAVGFRSPAMHHNLEWLHALDIQYDSSTFDTDPFEPDSTGLNTIFPQWIAHAKNDRGYVELPYTLPQDSTLYIFLQKKDIGIWKTKLDWIVQQGGMALLNTHPDYMDFSFASRSIRTYPSTYYREFLQYIHARYAGMYWHALPHEIAEFAAQHYRTRSAS